MVKASKKPAKRKTATNDPKADALAQRRELTARLRVERENVKLAEQLERAMRRSDLRLAELATAMLNRCARTLADDAAKDMRREHARDESRELAGVAVE